MAHDDYELYAMAEDVAVRAGAIYRCEYHPGAILHNRDEVAEQWAYAIGTSRWQAGGLGYTQERFMDAIKNVVDAAGHECPRCGSWGRG